MRKLFDPHASIYRVSESQPTADRAPDHLADGVQPQLREQLVELLGSPDSVLSRAIDLVCYATDASPYRLFPAAVVISRDVSDICKLFEFARTTGRHITFRAAGTSLSGQAQGDGILVEAVRHWLGIEVLEEGRALRTQPGVVLARANAILKPYGYRLGPDPASSAAATIGGVIANNASGMCCGTVENSYQTLRSMTVVLPSGTVIDTADPHAEAYLAAAEPEIAAGLARIKAEIEADPATRDMIARKYQIKNTTGYSMNAFLDGATPVEILRRVMVGSEGTLGFIAEAVYETVPLVPHTLTSLMIFPDMRAATSAVAPFVAAGAVAVELLDRASIRSVRGRPGVKPEWDGLPEPATALLVEFRDETAEQSHAAADRAAEVLGRLRLLEPAKFTTDPQLREDYWAIRNGLLASVGGARPSGTSFILEDVCFPPERLADGALALQRLIAKHGYAGVIFGHASAGNLHFLITPSLQEQSEIDRFDAFLRDIVTLVADDFRGSLKAEHGTGRNMAPFVEREWGPVVTRHMWELRNLLDPHGLLSPGVVLTDDAQGHVKHLKTAPTIEAVADRCIECGFCEPVCPSRRLTTTPRQRIALRREMMRQPQDSPMAEALRRDYSYDAVATCAGDGSCEIACPVDINTGDMMKAFRVAAKGPKAESVALALARRYEPTESVGRLAVGAARTISDAGGQKFLSGLTRLGRSVISEDLLPQWIAQLPAAAPATLPRCDREKATAVYFPACINRIFGNAADAEDAPSLPEVVVALAERAGAPIWIPEDVAGNCCATVWHSKGYPRGNEYMANKVVASLWEWTDHGRLPVICDATSCSLGLTQELVPYLDPGNAQRHGQLTIMDSIQWAQQVLLPALTVKNRVATAVIHPTCAGAHLQLADTLAEVVGALAQEVTRPIYGTCCGFAGDRGLLHPELADAAGYEQAAELAGAQFDAYLCSNRTCELGMSRAIGHDYQSFLFLLEQATR